MMFLGLITSQRRPWNLCSLPSCTGTTWGLRDSEKCSEIHKSTLGKSQNHLGWEKPRRTSSPTMARPPLPLVPRCHIPRALNRPRNGSVINRQLFCLSVSSLLTLVFIHSPKILHQWEDQMKANARGKWICVVPALGQSQECSGTLSSEGRKAPNPFPQKLEQDLLWFFHLEAEVLGILGWVQLLEEVREWCLCWISQSTEQTHKEEQTNFNYIIVVEILLLLPYL